MKLFGWTMALVLSLSVTNAATLYDPQAAEGRIEKKIPSPPIRDVIADVMARMEAHKSSETRLESQLGWPFNLLEPEKKGSIKRSKAATSSAANDY